MNDANWLDSSHPKTLEMLKKHKEAGLCEYEPGQIHEVTLEELESLAPLPAPAFEGWPKMPRLFKDMVITEKIDGTNAQILIGENGSVHAGSRKRWLHMGDDNHDFGKWVNENKSFLRGLLGKGRHFGEWWGQGIQRRYGMEHKVFSLFNTAKWGGMLELDGRLRVVPVLEVWRFNTARIKLVADNLEREGSKASPGFMRPEGICVFHTGANQIFKHSFENK